MIGQTIGHYRVLEKLGEGGMGVVYRAEDTRLGRQVALKALPVESANDPARRQRFQQEARAAAALNHTGIAAVHAMEEIGGSLYIVFEYVQGKNLRALLGGGAMPLDAVLELSTQVAHALASAHAHGIVHRDIKPENIVRTSEGDAKILDFGLARFSPEHQQEQQTASVRLTDPGTVAGTVVYMSPEQLEGKEPDFRSDIFSFGVLLYELSTGARPFEGPTLASTITRIVTAEPVPLLQRLPSVPSELDRIVRKCLRKKPGERYQSTCDLAVDLEDLRRTPSGTETRVQAAAAAPPAAGSPSAPAESSGFLQQPSMFHVHNPRRLWEGNLLGQMLVAGFVIHLSWLARTDVSEPWIFPALLVLCSSLISFRIYLLALAIFNPAALPAKARSAHLWLGAAGLGVVATLAWAGVELFNTHTGFAAILIATAIGGVVQIFFIEPTVAHSAFPRSTVGRVAGVPARIADAEPESGLLRRAVLRAGPTPRRWWELNHLFSLTMIPIVLYVVWLAKDARKDDVGLYLYYVALGLGALLGALRLYQLCVSMFIPHELAHEVNRVEPWQRRGDLVFMGVLLAVAASVATQRVAVAAFLGVIAMGGIVARLLVEPAISRAAFPSGDASQPVTTSDAQHRE